MIGQVKIFIKNHKATNFILQMLKPIIYFTYNIFFYKRYKSNCKKLSSFDIMSGYITAIKLVNTNMSLGRFGDGDISVLLKENNGIDNVEKRSSLISSKLIYVLNNSNKNFMIGLPDEFRSLKNFNTYNKCYWIRFINNNVLKLLKYLRYNKIYYNTSVTRPYIDYRNKKDSGLIFYLMKHVWKNKRVLIIEGNESRVGIGDDLLSYTKDIKRIECPVTNAFESYKIILHKALSFLEYHKNYISLLSLGPTATILSLDLCNHGFRAIDIGNLDLEYQWYLKGVTHRINLPYKYVTEVPNGDLVLPIKNKIRYKKEIISRVL